ncbi:GNAT family N-acetyltransferase [Pyrodictium abyssi]|uniref:N-acetyltransferase domain-containing protein n=1 Tax=Pyrodictium abyssi TaxID=54256 RepID=A0ABN6ZN09_9CREN|nr:hypothetical protein PABY_12130 [Pyrodictium abyssi]
MALALNVELRPATPGDVESMAGVYARAFGHSSKLDQIVEAFQVYMELAERGRGGCIVAEHEGSVVATGCYALYGGHAWIGAVTVEPRLQRRRIGTAVTRRLLQLLHGRVPSIGLDATPAGEQLYRWLGFTPEYRTTAYLLPEKPPVLGGRLRVEELDAVPAWLRELDAEAAGGDRAALIEAWLRRGAKLLAVKGEGYALVHRCRRGPLIARSIDAAWSLLAEAMARGGRRLIAPAVNQQVLEMLAVLGARETHVFTRMRLGSPRPEKPEMIYAIHSYMKG